MQIFYSCCFEIYYALSTLKVISSYFYSGVPDEMEKLKALQQIFVKQQVSLRFIDDFCRSFSCYS